MGMDIARWAQLKRSQNIGGRLTNELTADNKYSFRRLYFGSWSAQMVGPFVRAGKLHSLHGNRTQTWTVGLPA